MSAETKTVQSRRDELANRIVESNTVSGEAVLEVKWIEILMNLAEALNESKNIRDFGNSCYEEFLKELKRVGIVYSKTSNSFSYQPESSEWQVIRKDVLSGAMELRDTKVKAAAENRFKFNQKLPPLEEKDLRSVFSSIFQSSKPTSTGKEQEETNAVEKLLAEALSATTNLYDDNTHLFVGNGSRYDPNTLIRKLEEEKNNARLTADTVGVEAKVSITEQCVKILAQLKNETTLAGKCACFEELRSSIVTNCEAMFVPEVQRVLPETAEAIREAARYQDRANVRPPLLSSLDKLAERLVEFVNGKILVTDTPVSAVHVLSTAHALREEAYHEEKAVLQEKIEADKRKVSELNESISASEEASSKRQKTAELEKEQSGLQSDLTKVSQSLEALSAREKSLGEKRVLLEEIKEASKNVEKAKERCDQLQSEYENWYKGVTDAQEKIAELDLSIEELKAKSASASKSLVEAIDELVSNHRYLSTNRYRSWFTRLFGGLHSDEELARQLDKHRTSLSKELTNDEITTAARSLKTEIDSFLKNLDVFPNIYKASEARKKRLEALSSLCDSVAKNTEELAIKEAKKCKAEEEKKTSEGECAKKRSRHKYHQEKYDLAEGKLKDLKSKLAFSNSSEVAIDCQLAEVLAEFLEPCVETEGELSAATTKKQEIEARLVAIEKELEQNHVDAGEALSAARTKKQEIEARLVAIEKELEQNHVDADRKILTEEELEQKKVEREQLSSGIETATHALSSNRRRIAELQEASAPLLEHLKAPVPKENPAPVPKENPVDKDEGKRNARENETLKAQQEDSVTVSIYGRSKKLNIPSIGTTGEGTPADPNPLAEIEKGVNEVTMYSKIVNAELAKRHPSPSGLFSSFFSPPPLSSAQDEKEQQNNDEKNKKGDGLFSISRISLSLGGG